MVYQGLVQNGCFFTRGEGAWYDNGSIFFISTDGGRARRGQVWQYDIAQGLLTLIFESPSETVLNNPDNVTVSPTTGALLLCEDGGAVRKPQNPPEDDDGDGIPVRTLTRRESMIGLTLDGKTFRFAENNVVIEDVKGFTGDFLTREWAGATFSPDGKWLFANIQTPGITFAITGPWENGAL